MTILWLRCSSRGPASESYRLSEAIVARLAEREPGVRVVTRDVWDGSIPHVDEPYATALGDAAVAADEARLPRTGAMPLSETLIRELEAAECVVIGTPMHNYTVPSGLKAWLDHVVRVQRSFALTPAGKVGSLEDRPVLVAVSSGGTYGGEHGRQPDFLTPYLKAILATIGLHDITFFSVQGSGHGPEYLARARQRAQERLESWFAGKATRVAA
jgi:FMN-dependent NADH-azoreductase